MTALCNEISFLRAHLACLLGHSVPNRATGGTGHTLCARAKPASANTATSRLLPHISKRISTRTHRWRHGAPRAADGATSTPRRASTRLDGHRSIATKSAIRRPAAHSAMVAARGRVRLIEACQGVEQAYAVSRWWVSEGARARGADGSPPRGGSGDARVALDRSDRSRATRRAGRGAPSSCGP